MDLTLHTVQQGSDYNGAKAERNCTRALHATVVPMSEGGRKLYLG